MIQLISFPFSLHLSNLLDPGVDNNDNDNNYKYNNGFESCSRDNVVISYR